MADQALPGFDKTPTISSKKGTGMSSYSSLPKGMGELKYAMPVSHQF